MPAKAPKVALTRSQAACLIALRHDKYSKTTVAIEAKLDLIETSAALAVLAGLAWLAKTRKKGRGIQPPAGKDAATSSLPNGRIASEGRQEARDGVCSHC